MAYNEELVLRIRRLMADLTPKMAEKKMMGGLTFMLNDKMCCGVTGDRLMARIGAERYDEALSKPHCSEMAFTGKPFVGYVFIEKEGIANDDDLQHWLDLCIAYNAEAPEPKKKKTKN